VNLKELTNVKELVEDAVGKIGFIVEVLEAELNEGPDAGGDGSEDEHGHEAMDTPTDPLEDARIAAVHAYDILAGILDVTEPHRKRFAAQSRVARPAGNSVATASVASDDRQHTLPELGKEEANGSRTNASGKKLRTLRRQIG